MYDPLKVKLKVVLYTTVAFLFGLGLASGMGWTSSSLAMPTVQDVPQVTEEAIRPALDLSEAFVNIADAVTPAVVRIEVRKPRTLASRQVPEAFRRFFDIPDQEEQAIPQISGGSGFIVSGEGYILTNSHVVSEADEIKVYLNDGRTFDAELVGADPTTDVAVIRIGGTSLRTLSFGNSDGVRVGEWVLAVGNPGFGGTGSQLDYTVTAGIVSAKGRPLDLIRRELLNDPEFDDFTSGFAIEDYIQTDAVINPGNSGGPMVDIRGQVVGINSAIASRTGFYQGYGFAVPINLARRVMEDLIEYGVVRRPWLGVSISNVTPEAAEASGLPRVAGVLVSEVPDGGPAANAGIQAYDVIVSLDGTPVERVGQLQQLVARMRPGDRVRVGIYRDGGPQDITVRLGEAPIQPQPESSRRERVARAEEKLGINVSELTPELAQTMGWERAGGVVITDVQPDGPAARQGVLPGPKVLEINRQPIASADDVKNTLDRVEPGEVVSLLLEFPNGSTRVVYVRVPRS